MILLEILALIIVIAFVANGFKAGAIEGLGRAIGAILGFLAARAWAGWFITALALFMPLTWASLLAFLIIFLLVDHAVGFVFKIAEGVFGVLEKLPIIKQISSLIGGFLGLVEAIVVIGGVAFLLRQVAAPVGAAQSIVNLNIVVWIETVFKMLLAFLL